ncbi:hypothetical protein KP509_18G029200 [Ceratopteris richardii]|uniref:Signal peptide peptidase-like 1 n=1 Tax=Ceratopteris richardii TaxID=49495 RepID=A0A8T2SQI8_CERRI|nr:hypothetical protein KP509_18G029200 [Ceratopteris richardii]
MESLSELTYLLEPASLALIFTAVMVVYSSAQRALNYEKEMESHRDLADAAITLDSSQALMIPVASSCSLLLMFYLFASMSQIIMAFTAIASASSFAFCLAPCTASLTTRFGFTDPALMRCCRWQLSRSQFFLALMSAGVVAGWLISGHWILNNILGISICIAFVSHVRLPNIKICALLLACLFVYDIFWVFFSEQFFGANVMVSVAMQQASNPVHTVASSLKLPGFQTVTKKLELPVKLVFPRNLLGGNIPSMSGIEFMMLGLGDMAIPGMLLALVLCFDNRISKVYGSETSPSLKHRTYHWYALWGYALGLIAALAAGVLMHAPQPALLYLVPSTLGPVMFLAWVRNELHELWNGPRPVINEKPHIMEV